MNYEIVLATNNKHKLKEVREILTPEGIIVYGLADLGLKPEEVEENGNTYFENALIKAKAVQKLTSMPVISDDSGIEISALDWQPGIHSARFAESHGGYDKTFDFILEKIKDSNDRKARFVCDIVLLNVEEKPLLFEGIVNGQIANEPYGQSGFGYDPIFICDDVGITYAEMFSKDKNIYSHRARALKKLITYLKVNNLIHKPKEHHHD